MIIVLVRIETTAEDLEAIREAITNVETATRAEAGCIEYTFSAELGDPEVLRITERWESMEALAAHFQAPHMAAFQSAIGAHPPRDMQVSFYQATESEPPWRPR